MTPVDRETPFAVDELFFSTTDRRGVIRAGNDVFVRVSGYPEDALVGSPHNIVRHPDMPRAVFRLLWDTVAAGRPIAAYVKNMSADGSHYWVMATVVPSAGGFLSVRLKPTGPLLPVVREIYSRVRDAERVRERDGVPPPRVAEESVPVLLRLLAEAGFPDYTAFMRHALPREIRAREDALGARGGPGPRGGGAVPADLEAAAEELNRLFTTVEGYAEINASLAASTRFVMTLADDVRLSATNGIIAAARLPHGGATLAVVADEMSRTATGIAEAVGDITAEIVPAIDLLHDLAVQISTAKVQVDVAARFAVQLEREAGASRRGDLAEVVGCLAHEVDGLMATVRALEVHMRSLAGGVSTLTRRLRRLDSLQFAGRIEVAGVPDAGGFAVLFDEVRRQLEDAAPHVAALTGAGARTIDPREVRSLAAHLDRLRAPAATRARNPAETGPGTG